MNAGKAPLQGILFVLGATALFAALDTTTKLVSVAVPAVMAMWLRYLFQAAITAATQWPRRGRSLFTTRHPRLQALRGALLLACSALAYWSLQVMPVGEFTAIVMLTPLLMTLLAAARLGERVSAPRWALLGLAFAGTLLVIQPGGHAYGWALLLPLATLATNIGFQLLTSRLARTEDPLTMHFYTGCAGAAICSVLLPWGWQSDLSAPMWVAVGLLCVFSTLGHFLLILGYAKAGVAALTPFLYAQIAFATIAGWIVFAHVPNALGMIGLVLIGASGAASTWLSARAS